MSVERTLADVVRTIEDGHFYEDYDQSSSDLAILRQAADLQAQVERLTQERDEARAELARQDHRRRECLAAGLPAAAQWFLEAKDCWQARAEAAEATVSALKAELEGAINGLVAVKPILQALIRDQYNVETWGVKERLSAVDAALSTRRAST